MAKNVFLINFAIAKILAEDREEKKYEFAVYSKKDGGAPWSLWKEGKNIPDTDARKKIQQLVKGFKRSHTYASFVKRTPKSGCRIATSALSLDIYKKAEEPICFSISAY